MKELLSVDPISSAKVMAVLGVAWSILGWIFSGIAMSIIVRTSPIPFPDAPAAFSMGGLLGGIVIGAIGGIITGYVGAWVYNKAAAKLGGVKMEWK